MTASAEQGNQYAQYALGKLFLLGKDVPEDRKAAWQWFQKAAEQGDQYAQYFVERMDHRDLFPVVQSAARLLHHLAGIFREQSQPPHPRGLRLTVDKKLWRKIREKKIAMGHKPTIMKNRPSQCNGGFNVKKKYNSTDTAPSKAGRSARRLESWRRCATVRQVPYHRKTRQRRR